jgi:hypothetical protein
VVKLKHTGKDKPAIVKFLSLKKMRQFKKRGWVSFQIGGQEYELRGKDKVAYKIAKLEKQLKALKHGKIN